MLYFGHDGYVTETTPAGSANVRLKPRTFNTLVRLDRKTKDCFEVFFLVVGALEMLFEWRGVYGELEPFRMLKYHSRSTSAVYMLSIMLRTMVRANSAEHDER